MIERASGLVEQLSCSTSRAPARAKLLRLLLDEPSPLARRCARRALALPPARRDEPLRGHLHRARSGPHVARRRRALLALAQLGDVSCLPALAQSLDGTCEGWRCEALRALGRLGDPEGAQPLFSRLLRGGARERRAALAGLGCLGGPRAAAMLHALLSRDDPWLRRQACRGLARLGALSSMRRLGALSFGDPHGMVRRAARHALTLLRSRSRRLLPQWPAG